MDSPVLISTFLLTLLLGIGLFFFIRASVKDRTQTLKLLAGQSETSLLEQLQDYFIKRSYRIAKVDPAQKQLTFSGFVRPSLPLAIFLSCLAAVGLLCLALVLAILFPHLATVLLGLVVLAPCAGVFYWQQAGRIEEISLSVEPQGSLGTQSLITVVAHRDELIALQQALTLTVAEESAGE
jgi:hypothetical protein